MEPLDHTFSAIIGKDVVAGWDCVRVPNSRELLGTGKAVKITGTIDGHEVATALLPVGDGGHMLPVNAKIRKATGKGQGDSVQVRLTGRAAS